MKSITFFGKYYAFAETGLLLTTYVFKNSFCENYLTVL